MTGAVPRWYRRVAVEDIVLSPSVRAALEYVLLGLITVIGTALTLTVKRFNAWLRSKTESSELKSASEELDKFVEDTVRKGSSKLLFEFKLAAEDGKITRAELRAIVDGMAEDVRVQLGAKGIESIRRRLGQLDGNAFQEMLKTRVEAGVNALVDRVTLKGGIQIATEPQEDHSTTVEMSAPVSEDGGE